MNTINIEDVIKWLEANLSDETFIEEDKHWGMVKEWHYVVSTECDNLNEFIDKFKKDFNYDK